MSALYANAPTQNRDFNPDESFERTLPILASRRLAELHSSYEDTGRAELWNNVLAAEQVGHTKDTYALQMKERIEDKYRSNLLSDRDAQAPIMTDTDADFVEWGQKLVSTSLRAGVLSREEMNVHACAGCGAILAPAVAQLSNGCMNCPGQEVLTALRPVLLASYAGSGEVRTFNEVIVNKRRLAGVELDQFGYENDVIDPKIAIGLLAIYAAVKQDKPVVRVVTGKSSAGKNVPQLHAFLGPLSKELPSLEVVALPKAPAQYLRYLREENIISEERYRHIIQNVLPDALLSMSRDMTPETLDRLIFSRKAVH